MTSQTKGSDLIFAAPPDVDPRLVHIGEIRFDIGETSTTGMTPRGTYIYAPIIGGYLTTVYPLPEGSGIYSTAAKGLRAAVLAGGTDYAQVHENGLTEMNVSAACQGINNAHLFHITSQGVCERNALVRAQMAGSTDARSSAFGELNAWQVFRINTDSPEYGWLNFACIIGQERLIYEGGRLASANLKLFQFVVR